MVAGRPATGRTSAAPGRSQPAMDRVPSQRMLGPYQLLDRIGVGGMAEVWRATMRGAAGFERPVAIKRILGHLSADPDFVRMFVDEAKIAVQLSHPNIVQILDLGHIDDEWYIAMELVHGKDLRAILDTELARGQRIPLEVALHVIMKICDALHHAHFGGEGVLGSSGPGLRIVHRDVSPQNVMVSFDGEVKVADFGLAKAAGRAAQTQAGTVKGKLAYMSPEQLRGKTLDQRSDVFAVGILLWEVLAGERLFLGKTDRETIEKAYKAVVPSLQAMDPSIPPELEAITNRALASALEHRYQTAMELHDALEEFVYGSGLTLAAPSLSAYMRALYPQVEEVSVTTRRRDPRAGTAEIDVGRDAIDDGGDLDELDASDLESMPPPAPVYDDAPAFRAPASSLPPQEAAALVEDDGLESEMDDDVTSEPERSRTEPPTMVGDDQDWSDSTMAYEAGFGESEPTPEFSAGMARAVTDDDPDATAALDDDALYAAALAARPPPEDLVTRLHGPSERDLEKSREREQGEALPAFPDVVPTNVVVAQRGQAARPTAKLSRPSAAEARPFEGFDDDEQTTTAGGGGRRG